MCGFAGIVELAAGETSASVAAGASAKMIGLLRHRGPDEQRVASLGAATFAHTRLSILDVERSHQPMRVGNHLLAFNGEIYNFRAIRDTLEVPDGGWRTDGDTEVLLHLVLQRGPRALDEIEGMFAFALWNEDDRELLLGRDRFGKKPLYVATPRSSLVVFGSEPKSVLAHPEVDAELDLVELRGCIRSRAVYGDGSLYRSVRSVRPGEFRRWSAGRMEAEPFFDALSLVGGERPREDLATIMRRSVRQRLVADVPVGAFLSGGIDSSIVVGLMREAMGPSAPLHTYSVSFEGDPHDEDPFASSVANRFGATHVRTVVGPADFIDSIDRLSAIRDAPLSEPADIAVSLMSEAATRDVKVVLSGEGADEAFGGYPKYLLAAAPAALRAACRTLTPSVVASLASMAGLPRRRVSIAAEALAQPTELERLRRWFGVTTSAQVDRLFPGLPRDDAADRDDPQARALARVAEASDDPVVRMQFVDLLTWLPGNLLERGDRMTMAAGLEARMPFMSAEVFRLGLHMRRAEKISLRRTKLPLRELCAEVVGRDIAERRKWGFRVPLDEWFRGPLLPLLRDSIGSSDSFVSAFGDRAAIDALVDEHVDGTADHQSVLWSILTIEAWYRTRVRAERSVGDEGSPSSGA